MENKRRVVCIILCLLHLLGTIYCFAKVDPISLQERIKASDLILVGYIIKSYDTGIIDESGVQNWVAECQVTEALKGKIDKPIIKISFIQIPNQKPRPIHLEELKSYLLFLTERYEFISSYSGALSLEGHLWLYDDEISPNYSQDQQMTPEGLITRVKEIISEE